MKRLVVVESPTKARTIRKFLTEDYRVEASMGHIRDLPASAAEIPEEMRGKPWASLGVNITNGFEPIYVVSSDKQKVVRQLKLALKGSDELFIATDEDREGESIGWHLVQVLDPSIPVRRMVFHEITREAIERALTETRSIDQHLVDAQETRRILDRLVGYTLSPLLWKKIAPKLSAGRVQSVAVRVLVLRERERMAFIPASYWDLKATLDKTGSEFEAVMTHYGGIRLATGKDFDDNTGQLKENLTAGEDVLLITEDEVNTLAERLPDAPWRVVNIDDRLSTRSPYAPFITSTLQQEANRKLNLAARSTMQIAQRLYENGYITYMRTDSTTLSNEAVEGSRRAVEERYGKQFLSKGPKQYQNKVANAQEAHEAIRPAGRDMKTRDELALSGIDGALYDLIWKRTVASQMADARIRLVTAHIEAGEGEQAARFRASGRSIEFPGFFRAYVEGSDDPEAALEDRDQPLPELAEGDTPDCKKVEANGHETKPPARYTEASLVRVLEREGIGRPSTYATIIDTIVHRGYVRRHGSQLVPTFTAFAATNLLEEQFEQLVDMGFTAEMEQVLDDIATGERDATPYLKSFFLGVDGLEKRVEASLDKIDARKVSTIDSPKWNGYVVRVGKFGPYVEGELKGERATASVPDDHAPGDITIEKLRELLEAGNADDRILGKHPETGQDVLIRKGPYGPYVQLGEDDQKEKPKRISIPSGVKPEEVDLQGALDLLSLPRTLGNHPETDKPIKSNIGRYGPYVQHEKTYASLTDKDDVLTVGLDRALELLAQKTQKAGALRTLGEHPATKEVVEVWKGKYGPYVKHQKTNASLPKSVDPGDVTLDEALKLLEEREKKGKKGRKGGRSTKAKSKK